MPHEQVLLSEPGGGANKSGLESEDGPHLDKEKLSHYYAPKSTAVNFLSNFKGRMNDDAKLNLNEVDPVKINPRKSKLSPKRLDSKRLTNQDVYVREDDASDYSGDDDKGDEQEAKAQNRAAETPRRRLCRMLGKVPNPALDDRYIRTVSKRRPN